MSDPAACWVTRFLPLNETSSMETAKKRICKFDSNVVPSVSEVSDIGL